MDVENIAPEMNAAGKGKGKTIEQIYQKKTQLEHILLRPDTYSTFYNIKFHVYS